MTGFPDQGFRSWPWNDGQQSWGGAGPWRKSGLDVIGSAGSNKRTDWGIVLCHKR
jgi:hypothetical protein